MTASWTAAWWSEAALDTGAPLHRLAAPFAAKVADEAQDLLTRTRGRGLLDVGTFTAAWWRLVRRSSRWSPGRRR
ncbi:hypothetical protein [Nocardia grenadensis]|uniref:hypothetical protein n=1 Tax=Nocardia grenadensis TaxID=931537 RepID=UPI001FE06022|nr:hypothetical protein [Nocardia grenadensis]